MCASCVELVTFDQLRQRYPQLEQHRIAPSGGAFCRAERLKGGGAAGTYAMPRPMAPTGEKHFFGFYLTQRRLLLAEDGEFLRGLADDLEAGTPAQALAELFARLLQEDMPTLQKYEKRLTALEEALMQDQAQDLDKKLFRIRRELSVFAAYYEQLDDLFAVLSEETEEGDPHASRLFDHLTGRAQRLLSATEQEKEYALQLREMHQTQLDMRQNQIMKILTIVTTVFLPLSLIAGWYGMNFVNMPELTARHGYLAVCIVSAVCILVDDEKTLRKKIMRAVTDEGPQVPNSPKAEPVENLFTLLKIVSAPDTVAYFEEKYNTCEIRYGDLKKQLAEDILKVTLPIRERFLEIQNDEAYLARVVKMGAEKARESASKTLREVREIMGFKPF